jgi:hypothetical protein
VKNRHNISEQKLLKTLQEGGDFARRRQKCPGSAAGCCNWRQHSDMLMHALAAANRRISGWMGNLRDCGWKCPGGVPRQMQNDLQQLLGVVPKIHELVPFLVGPLS